MISADLVKNIPLFDGIAPEDVDGVLCICQRVHFEPGAYLIKQGQPADSAFIMESGAAEVITALPVGVTRLISQARIRARSGAQVEVEELQRALCTQDCRAGSD